MNTHNLSADTQAILLLCGSFGRSRRLEPHPLNLSEYNMLAERLQENNIRPADLLQPEGEEKIRDFKHKKLTYERLHSLLQRGGPMAMAVEAWTNKGLWIISRADKAYPSRLKARLGRKSPPILYGAGDARLLTGGGLAMVGSRDVGEEGLWFANRLACLAAAQGIQIVSGGARGVDSEAMTASLDEGGAVTGILSHNLTRAILSKQYRIPIQKKKLVLVSPFDPDAGFNVGNAMSRNKLIYALSDWSLVVNAAYKKGGTWSGAMEDLKNRWVPLFVWQSKNIPDGNRRLIESGGIPFDWDVEVVRRGENLREWLEAHKHRDASEKHKGTVTQLSLFVSVTPHKELDGRL